jgi:hypothetical protein
MRMHIQLLNSKQPVDPFIDYLDDVTREALRLGKQIIIIGDKNCDCLDESAPQTTALKEFLNVYKLTQLVREPTRSTASESLIDLLVITSPQLFWSTGVLQSGFSDHFPIFGSLISARQKDSKHRVISTRKVDLNANHEGFRNAISNIWDTMNIFDDSNESYSFGRNFLRQSWIFIYLFSFAN